VDIDVMWIGNQVAMMPVGLFQRTKHASLFFSGSADDFDTLY